MKNRQQEENTNKESSNLRESDASLDIVETSGSIEFDVIADITLDVVSVISLRILFSLNPIRYR